jgi:Glycosyl hydrolases family 39
MPDSMKPKPIPENYQRIEGSERRPASGERWVRRADPNQILPVIIRVKASAGQAGLDRIAEFARAKGLGLVKMSVEEHSVVVWGTVAQMSEVFAINVGIYQSPSGRYRGCDGHLHLPIGLAEIVEEVLGLIEREITAIENAIGKILGLGGQEGSGQHFKTYDLIVPLSGPKGAVNPAEFSLVQQFDVGWLLDPGCQRMLDYLQASPVAFQTVRVMKVFTCGGTPEIGLPVGDNPATTVGGTVWPAGVPSTSINWTVPLNALAELTSRNLIPFVVLSFFPDGVYNGTSYAGTSLLPMPIGPSSADGVLDWTTILTNWQALVESFFTALIHDPRFGPAAIAQWWFEVWNEPDNPSFWGPDGGTGSLAYYQPLYQTTCAAVAASVTANGYKIHLGGPTIMGPDVVQGNTTIPGTTQNMMSDFIGFVTGYNFTTGKTTGTPLECDFLSFHGKGEWNDCLNGAPVLQSAVDCADQTASFAQKAGLTSVTVINDEADMRANYDVPFLPRMTEQYPTWLMAMMIAYDSFSSEYAPMRFMAGSDNAELQLVGQTQQMAGDAPSFSPAAYGQQRSIMTASSTFGSGACPLDLLKVPAYNFYEVLRLLGDQHGTFLSGASNYYPHNSDLFHIITVAATHIGSVFCVYPPSPPTGPNQGPWTLDYSIVGIPWSTINWYQFQIDGTLSNGFSAAGGPAAEPAVSFCNPGDSDPFPVTSLPLPLSASDVTAIRQAQEFSVVPAAFQVGEPLPSGTFHATVKIPAYTTTVFWITQNTEDVPATPVWGTADPYTVDSVDYPGSDVILQWQPDLDPMFYSYEVSRDEQTNVISPTPLRSAIFVDTNPGSGGHTYWLRAFSASGVPSAFSLPLAVSV